MWTYGIIGIAATYLLIVIAILLSVNNSSKIKTIISVPLIIWFSVVLFFTLDDLLGYPTDSAIPDGAVIKGIHINEPYKEYPGVMCFWVIAPENFGMPNSEPRAYKMVYDRELHKQLMKKRKQKGGILTWRMIKQDNFRGTLSKLLEGQSPPSKRGKFEILNPARLLEKENSE